MVKYSLTYWNRYGEKIRYTFDDRVSAILYRDNNIRQLPAHMINSKITIRSFKVGVK